MKLPPIRTPDPSYVVKYPEAIEAAQEQFKTLWAAEELGVEKDENDVRVKLTDGERYALTEVVLKLFTQYELDIGHEFWSGKFSRMFPRHDMRRAANAFAFTELNSHAPFYDLINKTLGIATDEFYESWRYDPDLVQRMDFVEQYLKTDDHYKCLAAFSFMEGVVLYSNFAFLKSLNVNGYNMVPRVTAGVDISCKEENMHFLFSSWTYRQTMTEERQMGLITEEQENQLKQDITAIAKTVYEHEELIVQKMFAKGGIRTITQDQILHFIRNRIDLVLKSLWCDPIFGDEDGDVTEWFYDALSSYKYADGFANRQIQYVRNWSKQDLRFQIDTAKTMIEV